MPPLLLTTLAYADLATRLADAARTKPDLGEVERRLFPDGERYLRLVTSVEARDVVLLGGTISDSDTLELFDLACGVAKAGAESLTLVVPYFGYATMERAVYPGEVVTAKTRARLLSAVPFSRLRVLLLDLHVDSVAHYFEGTVSPVHVYAKPVILGLAKRLGGEDFVLASTDAGRAKWVESLANDLGVHASFVFKRRLSGSKTEVTAMNAQVKGKSVVLYDDMIRTGSSLLGAARAYLDAGATRVSAVATHGLFPGDALDVLASSGAFSAIACTDSHPRARSLAGDALIVESVAGVLAEALGLG